MNMKKRIKEWLLDGALEKTAIYRYDGWRIVEKYVQSAGCLIIYSGGMHGSRKALNRWHNGIRQACADRLARYLVASNSYRLMHAAWDGVPTGRGKTA